MSFSIYELTPIVPESESRQLDKRVLIQEKPYGYVIEPPAADTGDFDQAALESTKKYPTRRGRAI